MSDIISGGKGGVCSTEKVAGLSPLSESEMVNFGYKVPMEIVKDRLNVKRKLKVRTSKLQVGLAN